MILDAKKELGVTSVVISHDIASAFKVADNIAFLYQGHIIDQGHRTVKRVSQPMLGFKSFCSARILIGGIETMHMIRKGQMDRPAGSTMSAADQFYSLTP